MGVQSELHTVKAENAKPLDGNRKLTKKVESLQEKNLRRIRITYLLPKIKSLELN